MRGARYARTSNRVRRSRVSPWRPRLARTDALALSIPRPAGLATPQQAYGTLGTTPLLVRHLLRGARCMHGRRSLGMGSVVRLVLGLGGAVSFLAGVHPSASVYRTNRWFWWWRDRRGRASDLRSFLLRRHVDVVDEADEVGEGCARVSAGSGSHNLDAPYLARQRCRGN